MIQQSYYFIIQCEKNEYERTYNNKVDKIHEDVEEPELDTDLIRDVLIYGTPLGVITTMYEMLEIINDIDDLKKVKSEQLLESDNFKSKDY